MRAGDEPVSGLAVVAHVLRHNRRVCLAAFAHRWLNQCRLRRLVTILLLAVFGLPLASPIFALTQSDGSGLPACCRRHGKHHCSGVAPSSEAGGEHQFRAPFNPCPMYARDITASHHEMAAPPAAQAIFAALVSHPAGVAQVESHRRISRDRARHKRGPPSTSFL